MPKDTNQEWAGAKSRFYRSFLLVPPQKLVWGDFAPPKMICLRFISVSFKLPGENKCHRFEKHKLAQSEFARDISSEVKPSSGALPVAAGGHFEFLLRKVTADKSQTELSICICYVTNCFGDRGVNHRANSANRRPLPYVSSRKKKKFVINCQQHIVTFYKITVLEYCSQWDLPFQN